MTNNLDGCTIFRFTKSFKNGAGMEKYLEDLDCILSKRNKIKILRMFLETESSAEKYIKRNIGQGNLIEIPMLVTKGEIQSTPVTNKVRQTIKFILKIIFRDFIIYNPILYRFFFRSYLKRKYFQPGGFPINKVGEKFRKIHQEFNVDLLVMHHVGRIDSAEIIEEAKKLKIPYIYIHHYSNNQFNNVSIRELITDAEVIAGVSNFEVPKRLKKNFYNLSDGIDLELFDPDKAGSLDNEKNIPIIIYPARITRVKGQSDLVKAYSKLKSEGLHARIIFAGRVDSPEYEEELKELVRNQSLTEDVFFVGQLSTEELRDWYNISSIMAFPTYHQEGLGRILVEAQAMKVPPVAYIIGGTPEGIQNGETGFLVRKGDIKAFTSKLKKLLTNETKRKEMGEAGRKFVEAKYSLDALASRHENLYMKVLEKYRV